MRNVRVPRLFGTRSPSALDRIEEGYIFRITRAVPTGLIALATLALGVAVLAVAFSLIPPRPVREPNPAATSPEVRITLQDVQRHIAPEEDVEMAPYTGSQGVSTRTVPIDSAWLRLAGRVHAIRRLFPESVYSWDDRYETYCTSVFWGNCYGTAQRQTAWGISGAVMQAVNLYSSGSSEQWVVAPGTSEGYTLNVTDVDRKLTALGELEGILKAAPVRQRREILGGWVSLRREREQERLAQIGRENQRVESERAAEFARHQAAVASRRGVRATALMIIAGSITAVWMLGLTLALLAIERNTRPGRKLAAAEPVEAPSPASASALAPAH